MRFGLNLLLWTDTLTDQMLPLLEDLREIGFDAVEIPVFDLDNIDNYVKWGKRMDELGLARTGTAVRGPDENPISPDPAIRRRGIEANKRNVECCAAAGCQVMAGPFHSAIGVFTGRGPTEDEWKWGVEAMQEVAEHAQKFNVRLAVEYLNRFECYFINCAADLARFCRDVNHPYCRAMYDTFHSHIEEKNIPQAIRTLREYLIHVHISENDRSTPGQGNVRWQENFDALHEIGYDGFLVCEAFGLALEKLVPATKIWRRMYESEKQLARDALQFMKSEVTKRWK
ncbi:MAG: sugar phosphate isomerase/epimerase [Thermoguttaceae bacterium]|nr:sugar phosphate isomerase/epimerase [Thermoguttaceae bacterium]MDW8079284.1 sugar phosphate isomerase/epimerase family protein [Thermoguttaceae bacterium]